MRALTVSPWRSEVGTGRRGARAGRTADGPCWCETLAVGVCGTDLEIVPGKYGVAPPGGETGWSSATSRSAGCSRRRRAAGSHAGDLVVGIVRRPDPVPCPNCARGEWDMCRNGRYTERGIKELRRLRVRAVPDRPDVRGQGRPGARAPGRADGAGERAGQGVGAHRADRPPRRAGSRDRPGHRGRARSACWPRSSGGSAGWRVAGPRPGDRRAQAANWSRTSARPTTPASVAGRWREPPTSSSSAPGSSLVLEVLASTGPDGIVCLTGVSSGGRTSRSTPAR